MQLINKKLENERIALESTSQMSATPKFTMFNTDSSTVDKKVRTNSNISINIMDGIKEINGNNIENKNNVDVILDNLVQIPSGSSNMDINIMTNTGDILVANSPDCTRLNIPDPVYRLRSNNKNNNNNRIPLRRAIS
eukprot:875111_1